MAGVPIKYRNKDFQNSSYKNVHLYNFEDLVQINFQIYHPTEHAYFQIDLCRFFSYFFYATGAVSLFNLVLIRLNQYILICHNEKYKKVSLKQSNTQKS